MTIIVVHINGLKEDAATQSANPNHVIKPSIPQIVEVAGSESPSTISWRVRQDLSHARLHAIESSLENGTVWVPPSPSHRKTWEERGEGECFYVVGSAEFEVLATQDADCEKLQIIWVQIVSHAM